MSGKYSACTGKKPEIGGNAFGTLLGRTIDTQKNQARVPWTNQRIAQKLGSTDRTIRNWRNGKTLPSIEDFGALIAELLGDGPAGQQMRQELQEAWMAARERSRASQVPDGNWTPTPRSISRPQRWFGREQDVAVLTQALVAEKQRAVIVLGDPGIGKTSLTLRVATEAVVMAQFERCWFVGLEAANSLAMVHAALASAIGLDPVTPFNAMLARLQQAPGLLILDNLETSWEQICVEIEEILTRIVEIPNVALLASMRGRTAPSEPRWFVHVVQPLSNSDAAVLFREFASGISADDPHLIPLLDELGGLPLAVRLVAQQATAFTTLDDLWAEWKRRGTELAADPSREESRLTSVSRSIAFSIRSPRLKGGGMRLFRLLGQLPAGIGRRDRDRLLNTASFEAAQQLLSVGLAHERAGRLDLLPPVRDFARRLHPPKGTDAVAWVSHFLTEMKREGCKISTNLGGDAIIRLRTDLRNIEAAIQAAQSEPLRRNAASVIDIFWSLCSLTGYSGNALWTLAGACRAAGDSLAEADCIYGLAVLAGHRHNHDAAYVGYQRAQAIYRDISNIRGEANCIRGLAQVAHDRSDDDSACRGFKDALALCRGANDPFGEASCLHGLANVARHRSDYDIARENYSAALPLYLRAGHELGGAHCIFGLGTIARDRSEHIRACDLFNEALALYRKMGDVSSEANCILGLAQIAQDGSDHDGAFHRFNEALVLFQKQGAPLGEAICIRHLADSARNRSEFDTARQGYEVALLMARRLGVVAEIAFCQLGLATLTNDSHEAGMKFESALAGFREGRNLFGKATVFDSWASHSAKCGNGVQARLTEEAITLWEQMGNYYHAGISRARLIIFNERT